MMEGSLLKLKLGPFKLTQNLTIGDNNPNSKRHI
jgi:hypothetical protein